MFKILFGAGGFYRRQQKETKKIDVSSQISAISIPGANPTGRRSGQGHLI
jgi:hypothetical protein